MDTARDFAYSSHENPHVPTSPYLDDELFESHFDWQRYCASSSAHSGSIFQERTDDTLLLPEASPREVQVQDDEWTYPPTVPNMHATRGYPSRRRIISDSSQTADVWKSRACLPCRVSKTRCHESGVCPPCRKAFPEQSHLVCTRETPVMVWPVIGRTPDVWSVNPVEEERFRLEPRFYIGKPRDIAILISSQDINSPALRATVQDYRSNDSSEENPRKAAFTQERLPGYHELQRWVEAQIQRESESSSSHFKHSLQNFLYAYSEEGQGLPKHDLVSKVHRMNCFFRIWRTHSFSYLNPSNNLVKLPLSVQAEVRHIARKYLESLEHDVFKHLDDIVVQQVPPKNQDKLAIWASTWQLLLMYRDILNTFKSDISYTGPPNDPAVAHAKALYQWMTDKVFSLLATFYHYHFRTKKSLEISLDWLKSSIYPSRACHSKRIRKFTKDMLSSRKELYESIQKSSGETDRILCALVINHELKKLSARRRVRKATAIERVEDSEAKTEEKSAIAEGVGETRNPVLADIHAAARHGIDSLTAAADEETPGGSRTICTSRISKDSGYGSLETESTAYGKPQAIQEDRGADVIDDQEELHEIQTVYSDTSSLLRHPDIDKHISAFADELYRSLPSEFDGSDVERIFSAFPFLLKAFAVRLGHESAERMPRQLMYFVSRFRSEIAKRLQRMLHEKYHENSTVDGTNSEGASPPQNKPGMCLNDKIRMWLSKEDVAETDNVSVCDVDEADSSALDDLDDLDGLDDLDVLESEYRQVLARSAAYQWLRSSIRVKSTLQVPGPDAAASNIGDRIVKAVGRPNKFSRKRTQELRMHFVVDWDPFLFLQEQEYDKPLGYVLAHAITLTGYGNSLQAATCQSYMKQTWPDTGLRVLEFLQRTVKSESGTCEEVFPDRTRLAAQFIDSKLQLVATGNLFSVAEVAEQIAWIGAALRSSPDVGEAAYSTARITEIRLDNASLDRSSICGSCKIEFWMERLRDADLAENGKCWRGMFRNPVIVRGYPIPRRSEVETGLEISLEMVAALTNCRRVVKFAGMTFVKGFAAMLASVRVVGDVILWHLCYNPKGEYVSYEDHRVPRVSQLQDGAQYLAMDKLKSSRHIVGWSDDVRNFAGAPDADFGIEWTDLPSPNSMCVLEKVTISGSAVPFITSGASIAMGVKDKPLHLGFGSGDDYMGNLFTIEKRHFVFYDTEERRAWLVDGVSTVLHLLRAYLRFYLEDSRVRDYFIYSDGDIEEAGPNVAYTGAKAAYEVLKNDKNQRLPLYPKMSEESEERIAKLGTKREDDVTTLKATSTNFTLKERVEQLCYVLLQITAYHDDVNTQAGFGWRIKKSPRHRIEGFEFMDVATKHDTLWPKVSTLDAMSVGWVNFARALHAVPLFGVGFGELFRPVRMDAPCCASTASVPTGKDFLAVYGADLEMILRRGSKRKDPWRLVGNIHWHSPDGVAFESCKCESRAQGGDGWQGNTAAQRSYKKQYRKGQHGAPSEPEKKGLKGMFGECGFGRQKSQKGPSPADRVQVLLPATFPQFYGRGLRSPAKVVPKGAVIFGHSWKFPLRWSLTKDAPPEEGEPDPTSVDEVSNPMDDSGIGTSIDSSSGGDKSASPFFYSLGNNPQVPCGDRDDSSSGFGLGRDEPSSEKDIAEQVVQSRENSKKRSICLSEADDHELVRKLRRVETRIGLS